MPLVCIRSLGVKVEMLEVLAAKIVSKSTFMLLLALESTANVGASSR